MRVGSRTLPLLKNSANPASKCHVLPVNQSVGTRCMWRAGVHASVSNSRHLLRTLVGQKVYTQASQQMCGAVCWDTHLVTAQFFLNKGQAPITWTSQGKLRGTTWFLPLCTKALVESDVFCSQCFGFGGKGKKKNHRNRDLEYFSWLLQGTQQLQDNSRLHVGPFGEVNLEKR